MADSLTSMVEAAFGACSQIGFHITDDYEKSPPVIMVGFPDGPTGAFAYNLLLEWGRNDEVIAALTNRTSRLDLSLINSISNEIVNVRELAFDGVSFKEFVSKEPQDRRLAIIPVINPVSGHNMIMSKRDFSPLVLVRYIVVNADKK